MSTLEDFLGDPTADMQGPGEQPAPAPVAPPEEPQFVTSVTPSGIEVLYQWAPKRLYRVRQIGCDDPGCEPCVEEATRCETEWVEVPSVTTVLGVLDKPALPWWGMKTGVQGVLELVERGILPYALYEDGVKRLSVLSGVIERVSRGLYRAAPQAAQQGDATSATEGAA